MYGTPSAYTRTPDGTVLPVASAAFPAPQRALRPRTRPEAGPDKVSLWSRLASRRNYAIAGGSLLLLVAGGLFLAFGPLSGPQNAFKAALAGAMDAKSYNLVFTLSRTIGNSTIVSTYDVDVNSANTDKVLAKGTIKVEQRTNDILSTREGEFVLNGPNEQYMKLTSYSDENINGTNKGVDEQNTSLLKEVKNKWLITDEAASDVPLSTLVLLNPLQLTNLNGVNGLLLVGDIPAERQTELLNYNTRESVYSLASSRSDSFQGRAVYRYDVSVKKDKLQEYNQLFNKQIINSSMLSSIDAFTLYVDSASRLPSRLEVAQEDLSLVYDYSDYGKTVEIDLPQDAQTLDQALPGSTGDNNGGSLELEGAE